MKPQQTNYNAGKPDQGELIKHEVKKYLRYWIWFLLGAVIALVLAFLKLRYSPNIYSTSAKIQVLDEKKGLEMPNFGFNNSSVNLENEIEVLNSLRISERVARNLDLTMVYYEEGNIRTTEINGFPFKLLKTIPNDSIFSSQTFKILVKAKGFEVFKRNSDSAILFPNYSSYGISHDLPFELEAESLKTIKENIGRTFIFSLVPVTSAAWDIKSRLGISVLGKTSDLLVLSYTGENTIKSERVLNEVLSVFNMDGVIDRQEVSKRTINFIDERFGSIAGELDSIEGQKRDYKQDNNFFDIQVDAQIGLAQQTTAESEVFEIESQILLSNMLAESLNVSNKDSELLPANIGISSANTNELINSYNALIFERDNLLTSGGRNNPMVQKLNDKLEELQTNINTSLNTYKAQLQASKNQLVQRNNKFSSQVSTIPGKEKILRGIERQQGIKETLYLYLLQKREEAAINLAITEPSIKVVEFASSSGVPISPNRKNTYLMYFVAGLLIPFGVIYTRNLLDTKIKGKKDVQLRVDSVPILAEIPKVIGENQLFLDPSARTVQAEAFRILSSNVNYILPPESKSKGKVVYITSTIKGEGKTHVAINLSLALSSLNNRVLLIGADLRNPQLHNYTQPAASKELVGLSNYLHDGTVEWQTALLNGFPLHVNHDMLLAGSIPPNPAHLLTNGRFKQLLNEAKETYDYIIVDTAPTILVTDTLLISEFADATLYVVRADVTEKALLDFSKDLNDSGRLKNMAYIVNGVSASKSYGYSYNYGYGYGYGSDEK
ncbi:polysaccharide biosynthesis tyrosine autokinase [Gelidibacter salicanalis]|uniref:non-specific protein-tyrosine kinase n=1 Tax=Gelidibacter salicanalis TaxID=291193 RepID=A0A5C7ANZ1_9FLAO|nr:tyrosine-protein kinase family protein [Gelidibacter salicanalis]TXE09293.1 polysaccharide biosynthesis tyrosine autokinase [Gelidibacter salicanalis]